MKTITELMDDAKTLAKNANELFNELSELKEVERRRNDVPDILQWLEYADKHPFTEHGLVKRQDTAIASAYLSLLFSVAMCQISSAGELSPLVHPCYIAAALKDKINAELIFKESLSLDELTIRRNCEVIQEAQLESLFILDALLLTGGYDDKNHSKLEYIADLASVMEVSKNKMDEILLTAKAVLEEGAFVGKLIDVPFDDFYYYIANCPARIIETPNEFLAESNSPFTWTEELNSTFSFSNKEKVVFNNIEFPARDTRYNFSDSKMIAFSGCVFSGFHDGVFEASNIKEIIISESLFANCSLKTSGRISTLASHLNDDDVVKEIKKSSGFRDGIIGLLHNVESIHISDTKFNNCYGKFSAYISDTEFNNRHDGVLAAVRDIFRESSKKNMASTKHNRLFSGISKNKILYDKDSVERIDSCPIA